MDSLFSGGSQIKLEIDSAPRNLSFWGEIKQATKAEILVAIDGYYAQNEMKRVSCIVPVDSKICVFESLIKEAYGNNIVLLAPDADKISFVQRRSYVRVETNMPVKCFTLNSDCYEPESDKLFPAIIKDLSGGGALLSSTVNAPVGALLVFELLVEGKPLVVTAKIVRSTESNVDNSWDLGCEYIGIEDSDRQKIISYCSKLQLKRKKR
jgi:c-di-GMP-binding flagellar brake protein YcgR